MHVYVLVHDFLIKACRKHDHLSSPIKKWKGENEYLRRTLMKNFYVRIFVSSINKNWNEKFHFLQGIWPRKSGGCGTFKGLPLRMLGKKFHRQGSYLRLQKWFDSPLSASIKVFQPVSQNVFEIIFNRERSCPK